MDVNFTGFRNIGYSKGRIYSAIKNGEKTLIDPNSFVDVHSFNVELKDDFDGKDLTEFAKSLKASKKVERGLHPEGPDFMNVALYESHVPGDEGIYVNLNDKPVDICDDNLPIISYITKFMKKVLKHPDNKFVVNQDYLFSKAAAVSIDLKRDLRTMFCDENGFHADKYIDFICAAHSPEATKIGAKEIFEKLQGRMMDYFNAD